MKGGGGGGYHNQAGKRRWRFLATGVLFLVVLSMLVPLIFLLGIYNGGFHSTTTPPSTTTTSAATAVAADYLSDRHRPNPRSPALSKDIRVLTNKNNNVPVSRNQHVPESEQATHVNEPVEKFPNSNQKGFEGNKANVAKDNISNTNSVEDSQQQKDIRVPPVAVWKPTPSMNNNASADIAEVKEYEKGAFEESQKICEVRFGSYCLWRAENREDMKDSMVKKLKDQLFVARAYFPSVAKLPAQSKLSHDLKLNIQELERVLSESTTDDDLSPQIEKKSGNMEAAISRAKMIPVDCNNVDRKLRQILDMTEDEANFHMKQSSFLYQLAVQTKPKSLHCLSMKLTVEYFMSSLPNVDLSLPAKLSDPSLHHIVIFSNNVLASSVVINSTVMHARETGNLIFHVLTDQQNYFAMKLWFFRNIYKEAAIEVLNVEDLNLEYKDKSALLSIYLPMEFRVSLHTTDSTNGTNLRTEYLSIFSPAHYLLPYIFPNLTRVVVLDDDVVIQQDLSDLWNLNMGEKVNGAFQLCSVQWRQLRNYLGGNRFNESSCAWMSGLNVIDMARWKELQLTETFMKIMQQVNRGVGDSEAVALGPSLLTFQELIYELDAVWAVSGLGHNYGLDVKAINKAAVLHYNGRMKPWLELGIPKYKQYWKRFLNREDRFLGECNVNP